MGDGIQEGGQSRQAHYARLHGRHQVQDRETEGLQQRMCQELHRCNIIIYMEY